MTVGEPDAAPQNADDLESPDAPAPFIEPEVSSPMAGFCRLWAVAAIAHLVANPPRPDIRPDGDVLRIVDYGLAAAALWLFLRPDNTRARIATAILIPLSVWFEAPIVGNHWLLAGIVSLALLVASFASDPWAWFAPTARVLVLGFYSFAAFAKLNEGFFDTVASCGVFYTNQSLDGVRLPELPSGGALAMVVLVGVAAIELCVPLLLLVRQTRFLGVMLAATFHFLISLDVNQHFYDFSSVLFALFALFLTDAAIKRLAEVQLSMLMQTLTLAAVGCLLYLTTSSNNPDILKAVTFLAIGPWVVYGLIILKRIWRERYEGNTVGAIRVVSPVAAILLALVILNGLTPYLEIKTSTSWNMYANLVTGDGESNHLIVPRTWAPLGEGETFVRVLDTNDAKLEGYIDSGYEVPLSNLNRYLSDDSDASVTYVADGVERTLIGADAVSPNVFIDKFVSFRSIDTEDPPRCQFQFLPAR